VTRLTRRQIEAFSVLTTEQLKASFNDIENEPLFRTKRGTIRLSWAKHGDRILAEIERRKESN
jgi:hypothetical protein